MNLLVTGNGFDLSYLNSINSDYYTDYYSVINSQEFSDCLEYLMQIVELSDENLWTDFEKALGSANKDHYMDHLNNNGSFNSYGADDWSDADNHWHSQVSEIKSKYKKAFIKYFENHIINKLDDIQVEIEGQYEAITFNYIPTLENLGISNVQYLHGRIKDGDSIVLGHGEDLIEIPSEVIRRELDVLRQKYGEDEFDIILDYYDYDPRIKEAEDEFAIWYNGMKKNYSENFSRLILKENYDNVIICGISYNDIDYEYFNLLFNAINYGKIIMCVYSRDDYINAESYIRALNLSNVEIKYIKEFSEYIELLSNYN